MNGITEIDPVDFAAGVGHIAASQLFAYVSRAAGQEAVEDVAWYGKLTEDGATIEADVIKLAGYINRTTAGGEQLWRWGNIHGLVEENIPESGLFSDLAIAHQLAFNMFATVSRVAIAQIDAVQLELAKTTPAETPAPAMGLKLEDSIFEPEESLFAKEPYQQQYLADEAAAASRRLDEAEAADQVEEQPALSLGEPESDDDNKPAAISVGQQGDEHEEGDAGEGQEEGDAPAADTSAQGDVSGLSDDEPAEEDPAGEGDDDAGAEGGEAAQLGGEVAEQAGEGAVAQSEPPVRPKKTTRRKSSK